MPADVSQLNPLTRYGWRLGAFLAKGPAYAVAYGRWKLGRQWQALSDRFAPARLDDAALLSAIDLRGEEKSGIRRAVDFRDFAVAGQQLSHYFKHRARPVFHFGPEDRDAIVSLIADERRAATVRAADDVCRDVFTFRHLGPVRFESGIDWVMCPQGNVDWMWDLNRHAYFNTLGRAYWYTGDEKYAAKFVALVQDWIDKNPARVDTPNWKSVLEIAARLNNWIWAYHFFLRAAAFSGEAHLAFLKGMLLLARHLSARIEHHATNNHLFLEAKALAICGVLFPEFKEAAGWRETGLRILWRQVEKQVCSDGVHAERSTLYQRAVTSELLDVTVLLADNGMPIPAPVIDRLERMIAFDLSVTKPDGSMPLLGDSSLEDTYVRFTGRRGRTMLFGRLGLDGSGADEEMAWLLARQTMRRQAIEPDDDRARSASQAFVEGGYFVMRSGAGREALHLVFDCGPFGYRPVPGHGHADALAFDLYAYGRTLITDCGAYSYYLGERWRNYFRGTRAHNTLVVDGQDQSILAGSRHVYRMARATLHQWLSNAQSDFVDGSHDGYQRLAQPVTHRRCILFVKPEYWIVVDLLTGRGVHTLAQHFHLMPWANAHVDRESKRVRVDDRGAPAITIAPANGPSPEVEVVSGATDPIQGWVSFHSGEKLAAPVVTYRRTARLPALWCTVLYPHPPGRAGSLQVADLDVAAESGPGDAARIASLTVETDEFTDTCVIDLSDAPAWKSFADHASDARLIHLRHSRAADVARKEIVAPRGATLKSR